MPQPRTTIEEMSNGSVVAYGRFSSDDQNATSIEDQVMAIHTFVRARNLRAPMRVIKDEGVSVKDGMAPSFKGLLDEVRAGQITKVYVDELSRISRLPEYVLRVQRLLRFLNVQLWAVHESIEITDENSDVHVLFASHKNQAASRDARHRIKRSMDGNLQRGLSNGDVTLGYKSVELTAEEIAQLGLPPRGRDNRPYRRLVVHEDEAEIVRLIFRLWNVERRTLRQIVKYLNENGVPRGGKARTNKWRIINVRKVLSSRRYLGFRTRNQTMIVTNPDTGGKTVRAQPRNALIEKHAPALVIIDQRTFDIAQKRLAENAARYTPRRKNRRGRSGDLLTYAPRKLFAGTIVCGECGAKMVQKHAGKVAYYVCPEAQARLCGNTVQANRDLTHRVLLDLIREEVAAFIVPERVLELVRTELRSRTASTPRELMRARQSLRRTESEIRNLTNALALRPDSPALYEALDAREHEKVQLEAKLRDAEQRAASPLATPTVEWVEQMLRDRFEEVLSANVSRAALVLRKITGPIRILPNRKPWLKIQHPIARFTLDFAGMTEAIAADHGEWQEGVDIAGFGREFEVELRKIPLYEKYAEEVVRLRDDAHLSWTAISRQLTEKMTPETVATAYRFGKTGDLYGHRRQSA